jgi:hypothetical protein
MSTFRDFMDSNIQSEQEINLYLKNDAKLRGVFLSVCEDYVVFSGKTEDNINIVPFSSIVSLEVNPLRRS